MRLMKGLNLVSNHAQFTLCVPRIIQDFFPYVNGPAKQALAISEGLNEYGILSPILTTTPGSAHDVKGSDLHVHRFHSNIAWSNFRISFALWRYLEKIHASLYHIHSWRNPASDSALLIARRRKIPIVIQSHGVAFGFHYSKEAASFRILRHFYEFMIRRLVIRTPAAVIASTRLESEELIKYGFPKSRILTIPAGVHNSFFSDNAKPHPKQEEYLSLLTVARIAPRRNLEQIIHATAILQAQGFNMRLRIVGSEVKLALGDTAGYLNGLKKLVIDLGIGEIVDFTGPLFGADLINEYKSADIFLYTSLYENFGQPIAEAASVGLPIVSTPTGIALELLSEGDSGFLVPFQDYHATARKLIHLITNPDLRWRYGLRAKERARTHFDWKKIVLQYIDLYNSIISERLYSQRNL